MSRKLIPPDLFIYVSHLFFARRKTKKKDFPSFFSCGATPSRTVPKTGSGGCLPFPKPALEVAFSLLEGVDLRSQKDRILEKKNCVGKGGVDRGIRKKDAHKRWGNVF